MRFKEEGDKVIALALTDHEEAPVWVTSSRSSLPSTTLTPTTGPVLSVRP